MNIAYLLTLSFFQGRLTYIRPNYASACPVPQELERAVSPGKVPVLVSGGRLCPALFNLGYKCNNEVLYALPTFQFYLFYSVLDLNIQVNT